MSAVDTTLLGRPLSLVLVLSLVGLLPFAFMALTSFVKIATVLQIVRGAIGAESVPSSAVVLALSAALTLIAMAPVGSRIAERLEPLLATSAAEPATLLTGAIDAVREPLRGFLSNNAAPKEKQRFLKLAQKRRAPGDVSETDLMVVVPAFLVTELLEAFTLGFAIYLPFLVIDLVVANVLIGLGMQMMNPNQISLPFKLLLFVAADGWGLLAEALVTGYVT
ncbi:MAG TPA: flagellar type III secretion system pore protein FliP [Polyangiaceae bacterium]|nr:flagellar type III secretion system pore protein FliP [Polyangiaceae bacterium]